MLQNNYTFKSKELCEKNSNINTNPKFKTFKQFVFTCGDKQDLKDKIIRPRKKNKISIVKNNNSSKIPELINQNKNLFINYPLYKIINREESFRNSLKYLFFKIKFGIYVQIKSNKLTMFVPFNNQNFKNNWYSLIKLEDNINWNEYNQNKAKDIGSKYINWEKDMTKWEIDNCVLDNRANRNYKLINASYYISMFNETLKTRKINDVEFFINHRDFPILKNDYTQPYDHLYNSDLIPLEKKYKSKKFLPITSMASREGYMDIMLPTVDDWEIVNNSIHHGMCRDQYIGFEQKIEINWDKKISKVIFRGATTDCGFNSQTSARYLVHKLSQMKEIPELDAGITKLWFNDIKLSEMAIHYPERIEPVKPIPFIEMSHYKYILNIDGSVTAFRLSAELAFGSVILKVDSDYKIWYLDLLKPYIHYIPIKKDLSDLKEKINWCKENDETCKIIGLNARKFYFEYINKEKIMDYIEDTLNLISCSI
jgi:hypothetical protein